MDIIYKSRKITVDVSKVKDQIILDNLDCFKVEKNINNEWDYKSTKKLSKKRKISMLSICRCPVCKKYFLRGYTTKSHIIQCVGQSDNLKEEFYRSSFEKLEIKYNEIERISVKDMLYEDNDSYMKKYKKQEGVWALWKENKCITVAKTQNIYNEIFNDFEKGKGSIDYTPYKDGKIAIVSLVNSFEIEAKYAFDHKAEKWGIFGKEWKQIKDLLNTPYFDNE